MNVKSDDIKATLLRLQGQMDAWTQLYQAVLEAEKKPAEIEHDDTAPKG